MSTTSKNKRLRKIADKSPSPEPVLNRKTEPSNEDDDECRKLQEEINRIQAELNPSTNPAFSSQQTKKRDKKEKHQLPAGCLTNSPKPLKKKKPTEKDQDEELEREAQRLKTEMYEAYEDDHKSNKEGKPALQKLMKLESICKQLKKIQLQDRFIDCDGLACVAKWLEQMPDGTYPNIEVVREILLALQQLQIDSDSLETAGLGKLVCLYAKGVQGQNQQVQALAKSLKDKWHRVLYSIDTDYHQQFGATNGFEDNYIQHKNKLKLQSLEIQDENGGKSQSWMEFKRGRQGIIMPTRNAFDFVQRPEFQVPEGCINQANRSHGQLDNLRKKMEFLKKDNRMQITQSGKDNRYKF